jgi:hypothetical protein
LKKAREAKAEMSKIPEAVPVPGIAKPPPAKSSMRNVGNKRKVLSFDSDDDMADVDDTELKEYLRKRRRSYNDEASAAKRFKITIPSEENLPAENDDDESDDSILKSVFTEFVPRCVLYGTALLLSLYLAKRNVSPPQGTRKVRFKEPWVDEDDELFY